MFYPIEGGSVYEVHDNAFGFVFKCNRPPIGYGINSVTNEIQPTDIICRSDIAEQQYWERYSLPLDWKVKRQAEKDRQRFNKYYADPELEQIRKREWNRRLNGVWFWNYNPVKKESELIYITGTHYLYCTYWKFQGRYMDFRINDMEFWYIMRYAETDPNCLGISEITKRKLGKTAKLGCWLYDRTSKPPYNQHGGLQSKADDDAEEVMKKALVQPWQKLPDFFRPIYDTMKGDDPNELRFFHTSRRGSSTEIEREEEDALESWVDFGASGEGVYDGPELDSYAADEAGKTKRPVSIKERQNTVRYCSEIDGEFTRKDCPTFKRTQLYTTTVEIEKGEEENYEFHEMTAMSNPLERDDNGRTITGLYTYFLPAQKGMYFDKYGYPDEERAIVYLLNTRKKLQDEGKLRELSSFKRKNPMTLKEAFSVDGADALYNPELLDGQYQEIAWRNDITERGDLEWVDGFEFLIEKEINGEKKWVPNELEWRPNPNGKFEKLKDWWPREANRVYEQNGYFFPNNNFNFRIGCDPFKYDKTKDKRRSKCAAFGFQIGDPLFPDPKYDYRPVIKYSQRPEGTGLANMEVAKMGWLLGCQILFERNVNHWKKDFSDWKMDGFLMWMPGELEPGIYTDGKGTVVQTICNYTESYINKYYKNILFKSLIQKDTGLLGFKVDETQKYDEPMGFGFTLIAVKGKKYVRSYEQAMDVEDLLPLNEAI